MSFTLRSTRAAERDLRQLDRAVRARIIAAIDRLADDPRPPGRVELHGSADLWRVRVGDWRVIYVIDDAARVVTVTTIGHRSDVYR